MPAALWLIRQDLRKSSIHMTVQALSPEKVHWQEARVTWKLNILTGTQMVAIIAKVTTEFLLQYFGSAYQPPAGLQTAARQDLSLRLPLCQIASRLFLIGNIFKYSCQVVLDVPIITVSDISSLNVMRSLT